MIVDLKTRNRIKYKIRRLIAGRHARALAAKRFQSDRDRALDPALLTDIVRAGGEIRALYEGDDHEVIAIIGSDLPRASDTGLNLWGKRRMRTKLNRCFYEPLGGCARAFGRLYKRVCKGTFGTDVPAIYLEMQC